MPVGTRVVNEIPRDDDLRLPQKGKVVQIVSTSCYPLASGASYARALFQRHAAFASLKTLVSVARALHLSPASLARSAHSHTT